MPPGGPQDATRRQEATRKPPVGHQEARSPSSPTRPQHRPAPTRPPVPFPPDSGTDRHRDRPPNTGTVSSTDRHRHRPARLHYRFGQQSHPHPIRAGETWIQVLGLT